MLCCQYKEHSRRVVVDFVNENCIERAHSSNRERTFKERRRIQGGQQGGGRGVVVNLRWIFTVNGCDVYGLSAATHSRFDLNFPRRFTYSPRALDSLCPHTLFVVHTLAIISTLLFYHTARAVVRHWKANKTTSHLNSVTEIHTFFRELFSLLQIRQNERILSSRSQPTSNHNW